MALRIRFQYPSGGTLGYSIERLVDGLFYDFGDNTFKSSGWTTLIHGLPADTGSFVGRYKADVTTTNLAQWTDGDYCVTVHNTAAANQVVGQLGAALHGGLDTTYTGGAVASVVGDVGGNLQGNVLGSVVGDVGGKVLGGGSSAVTGVGVRADVRQWVGVAVATPLVAGMPVVDVGSWRGTAVAATNVPGVPIVDLGYVNGSVVSLASGAINATLVATGLDAVSIALPAHAPATLPQLIACVYNRLYGMNSLTAQFLTSYRPDGVTVMCTQNVSDDGTIEVQNSASFA